LRELALKRLRTELREDSRRLQQFLWEARVTAHLDHPNIVPLHDIGIADDGTPYFTMKYVRGRSLRALVDGMNEGSEPRLPPRRRLRLFLQLCHAIEFAHARGVLHRDLKPENIMIGDHGELLVMDWGIAVPLRSGEHDLRDLASDLEVLGADSISGTPMYMSPEQASGQQLDERSDVYTLGVILYELMALRRPFEADTLPELMARIVAGRAVPLSESAPELSPSIVAVIEHAMQADPAGRYSAVAALRADVEHTIDGGTPAAEHASLARRFGRFYLRPRNPWMASLRAIDVELFMGSSLAFGVALAAWLPRLAASAWPSFAIGAVIMAIALASWIRNHRHGPEVDHGA
jgi:serine/threonine protein kinase